MAEIDGQLLHLNNGHDSKALQYIRAGCPAYPHLMVPEKLNMETSDAHAMAPQSSLSSSFSIFRPNTKRKPTAGSTSWIDYAGEQLLHWLQVKDEILNRFEALQNRYVTPYLNMLQPAVHDQALPNPLVGPVRHLDWHPYRHLFSVCHQEDVVFIYDMEREGWFVNALVHPFQTYITGLAWKPNAGSILAVGCRQGVGLWRVELDQAVSNGPRETQPSFEGGSQSLRFLPNDGFNLDDGASPPPSTSTGPARGAIHTGHAWLDFLQFPGFTHISCLAWDPTGRYLAVGSSSQATILIWEIATATATPLRRVPNSTTVTLTWSPDGMYLCSTHTNRQLRIWDVSRWQSVTWSDFPSFPHQVVWAPDSRCLFFALHNHNAVYHLVLHKPPPALDGQVTCLTTLTRQKLAPPPIVTNDAQLQAIELTASIQEVGGYIHSLALDPACGERLIISFRPNDRATEYESRQDNLRRIRPITQAPELIAVLHVKNRLVGWVGNVADPTLPCGFIRGPAGTEAAAHEQGRGPMATCLSFAKQFDRGALLTVGAYGENEPP
ncbi:hypothetical protein BJ085DRAFT_33161 [Dimargaris cristalligena]|uniref:Uncharacterized protein n=1 Tax=Dimargaris cristalligena TaxID=215637 RepID=A0A4Q0A0U2_9FUNG|nr:hypothetical protein BJ085DRAFT_33161 [Dimargaris cristalligena]|eukprot:RKP38892.1 hypothetical protein BJ085DRAFT_33161 [Dimargaris cristalligena]